MPALSMRRRVRIGYGRELSLGEFLADWGLPPTSNLVRGLRDRGWAGGGDVERVELVTFNGKPNPTCFRPEA